MQCVVLKLRDNGRAYFPAEKRYDGKLITLASFLTDAIGYSKDSIEKRIDFINNPHRDSISINYNFLEKYNGKILLGCDLDFLDDKVDFEEAYEKAYENTLEFQPQQLIDILNSWHELCSRKPEEIIITQDDNNNITLEGRNFPKPLNE